MTNLSIRNLRRRAFTLAELMVAMIVLMLIVYMLFRVIGGAQRAWQGSRAISEMHDSASLAMDVIGRDMKAMKASDTSGALINYAYDGGGVTDMKFSFVTTSGLGVDSSDNSMLSEVGYSFSDSTLYRWRTTYSAGVADWDFYNAAPSGWASATSWEDSTVLATGVASVAFTAYSDSVTQVVAASDSYVVPSFVNVALTVHDQRKDGRADQARSKLSFSKTIHLNRSE